MNHKVAVYGSLKSGHGNHGLLKGSIHVGNKVVEGFDMFGLGSFPGIKPKEGGKIFVEVYEVDDTTLERLDWLEGYSPDETRISLYDRQVLPSGEFIYVYNRPSNGWEVAPDAHGVKTW